VKAITLLKGWHFADRDDLLAAVAVRAAGAIGDALTRGLAQAGPPAPPDQRLAALAAATSVLPRSSARCST
jgi:AcrR family transcriptional regulator